MTLLDLKAEAEALAGRPLEVDTLKTGKKIVLWMNFSSPPPEPADTEEGAFENFIRHVKSLKQDPIPEVDA